jgi:hypothetical protein
LSFADCPAIVARMSVLLLALVLAAPPASSTVASLLANPPAVQSQVEVVGYVQAVLTCPPCPPGAMCKRCPLPGIHLGDGPAYTGQVLRLGLDPIGLTEGQKVRVSGWVVPLRGNTPQERWTLRPPRITDAATGKLLSPEPLGLPLSETLGVAQVLSQAAQLEGAQVKVSGVLTEVSECPPCPAPAQCAKCAPAQFTLEHGGRTLRVCVGGEHLGAALWEVYGAPVGIGGTFSSKPTCGGAGPALNFSEIISQRPPGGAKLPGPTKGHP